MHMKHCLVTSKLWKIEGEYGLGGLNEKGIVLEGVKCEN